MSSLIFEIIILTSASTALVSLCLKFNIPSIVGFIFTGMVVGPHGLGLVATLPDVRTLTEWVGMLLMFTIGLEFNRQKLLELKHQFLHLGPAQVLGTVILTSAFVFLGTETSWRAAVVWGMLLSLSSTALVLKLLHDHRDIRSPHGQNSMGILVFQDLAVIPMLLILPLLASKSQNNAGYSYIDTFIWLLKSVGVLTVTIVLGRTLLPRLLTGILRQRSQELFFFAILALGLASGEIFHKVGLSASLGAFVAGFIIAESELGTQTSSVFVPMRDALLGLFFATIGALIDFQFLLQEWPNILLLSVAGFLLKLAVLYFVCRLFKWSKNTSLITALTLAQVGEFSFILASRALDLGLFSPLQSQYFMTMSILSMVGTPILYRGAPFLVRLSAGDIWSDLRGGATIGKLIDQLATPEALPPTHLDSYHGQSSEGSLNPTLIIGFGIAGQNVARSLLPLKKPIHVIEMNYAHAKSKNNQGVKFFFGDATELAVLTHAGLLQAMLVVITVSSDSMVPRIIEVIRRQRPDIEIIVRVQYVKQALSLKADVRTKVIVAEVETTLELLAEVLRFYGADEAQLPALLAEGRSTIKAFTEIGADREGLTLTLPHWAQVPSLMPYRVAKEDFVCGKTLAFLELPKRVRASVATLFREGFGTMVPYGDFVINSGDVLHLLVVDGDRQSVRDFLKSGEPKSNLGARL